MSAAAEPRCGGATAAAEVVESLLVDETGRKFDGWSRLRRDEGGQAIPLILLAIMGLLATGVALTQVGRLTELRASATTSADAAALAGADRVADALKGEPGLQYVLTGTIDRGMHIAARGAANGYASANDATLTGFSIRPVDATSLKVRTGTETRRTIGEPAASREMADTQGRADAAAVVEIGFLSPPSSGCVTPSAFERAVRDAGVPTPASSGLLSCRGVNLRYAQPAMLAAVLRVEAAMGSDVQFTAAFVTLGEQMRRYPGRSRVVPGASLLHWGLGFEAANAAQIAGALEGMSEADRPLCQPYGRTSPYFSVAGYRDCGGRRALPALPFVGIEVDVRLADPDEP